MKRYLVAVGLLLACVSVVTSAQTKDDHYARGIVIQALTMPNNLGVGGREFRTKPNPKGQGVFVYDPRTEFKGVQRNLIWLVVKDQAYPLNGSSKTLTPSLIWPRDADQAIWRTTGLDPYMAMEVIKSFLAPSDEARVTVRPPARTCSLYLI